MKHNSKSLLAALERASCAPDHRGIIDGDILFRYSELGSESTEFARVLADMGVRPGDRVLAFCTSSVGMVNALYACLKLGALFVPMHPDTPWNRLEKVILDCRPQSIILDEVTAESARFIESRVGLVLLGNGLKTTKIRLATGAITPDHAGATAQKEPGVIFYTSGTTGKPKGVLCPASQISFCTAAINSILRYGSRDVILACLPFAFDYGLYQILLASLGGASIVIDPRAWNPYVLGGTVERHRVSHLPLMPSLLAALLDPRMDRPWATGIRCITSTGDVLTGARISQLQAGFPEARVFSMYGLTECKRVSILLPEDLPGRAQSVGKPLPGTRVRLANPAGGSVEVGEVGELIVSGPNVAAGYWNDEELTRERFFVDPHTGERSLRTGDSFRTDAADFLYFVFRDLQIIKFRGHRVAIAEIEQVLTAAPGVLEACVVALPVEDDGQWPVSFVRVSDSFSMDLCLAYCGENLAKFAMPRRVSVEESLPRTSNGKVDRTALKKRAASLWQRIAG